MDLLLTAMSLQLLAGTGAWLLGKYPRAATAVGVGGTVVGCAFGVYPTLHVLLGGSPESLRLSWDASHGAFLVELDALSAFFLLPVLGLSALAAVYGGNYLLAFHQHKRLGSPWFFFNVFVAGMILVLVARTALLFLVAWEIMSVAAYCLVTFEQEKAEVRRAGWVYLIATHLGVVFLFLAFTMLGRNATSLDFEAFRSLPALAPPAAGLIFLLALIGFGTKAGLVPFHVWLPEAHPAAPSHVSALMSGVMIKMGLYGLLRVLLFLGRPALWWGPLLAAVGLATGLLGVALALQQRDVKRVLAYSSIENMGLIALALGVGLWGLADNLPAVAVLGLTAGLLHVWNHALMKGLMFFSAGSIVHGTSTRDMEKLGGLMQRMPWTGTAMMIGAVAIAGLPPLNGFVSEWLMYLGLMNAGFATSDSRSLAALFAVGLLALVGAAAAAAFVRLSAIVLLGTPRSEVARHAHESSPWMLGPIFILLFLCLIVALLPRAVAGLLAGVLDQISGGSITQRLLDLNSSHAPLRAIGVANAAIIAGVAVLTAVLLSWTRRGRHAEGPTWGCGYVKPTARMQYTGRSFAEFLADHALPRFLRPRATRQPPKGLFPHKSDFGTSTPDPVSEKVFEPLFRRLGDWFSRLRILQQGKVHVYLVYILLMVVLALGWVVLRTWWVAS